MITIKAPGKLMLAGEWAVLEQKPCIVMAIDKFVEVNIEETSISTLKTPYMEEIEFVFEKNKIRFRKILTNQQKADLLYAKHALETFLMFMAENANPIKSFRLETKSHDTVIEIKNESSEGEKHKTEKLGFGSSAAVIVAIGTAIMKLYEYDINDKKIKDVIFKLASIAHFTAQEFRGSCFDIAASVYGNILYYKTFNALWLRNELSNKKSDEKKSILEILDGDWPGLKIKPIKLPENVKVLCCYTGKSSSTNIMMMTMDRFKNKDYNNYIRIIDEIETSVDSIIDSFDLNNDREVKMMIHKNQNDLKELNNESKAELMTPELEKAIEIANNNDCVGKISGAGGGDCAIAFCFDDKNCKKVISDWKESELYPIDVNLSIDGVKEI